MMIAADGQKRRLPSEALRELKTKHVAIERKRPVEIGHLQMNVADAYLRIRRKRVSVGCH